MNSLVAWKTLADLLKYSDAPLLTTDRNISLVTSLCFPVQVKLRPPTGGKRGKERGIPGT